MKKNNRLKKLHTSQKYISCITSYDATFSNFLDRLGVDIILVGDSLGQVIKGDTSTHKVSLDEILYHAKCVKSGIKSAMLMVDLPKDTYATKNQAYKNSKKIIHECKADLIKIEIDDDNLDIAGYLVSKNVPLCGHIGLLPQSIKSKKGYRKYGRNQKEADSLFDSALNLDQIGTDLILLECVEESLAKRITEACKTPVIGIGSGNLLDGQVAVIYDLLGISFNQIPSLTSSINPSLTRAIKNFINKK
jgi:3-methyl-2-oxobutanoate hydroxymethyltransferase